MYLERATGEAIAHAVIECLKDHNIDISKARKQSYNGAHSFSSICPPNDNDSWNEF